MNFDEAASSLGYSVVEGPFVDGLDTVYRATHNESGDTVALRVVPPGFDTERFTREADVLATIEHPGIANLREHHHFSGWSLLVLDWIEGETLEVFMERRGAVSVAEALHIVDQLTAALDSLHSAGIVHPRLTPRSVVALAGSGPRPKVKLIDLAISRGEIDDGPDEPDDGDEDETVVRSPRELRSYSAPEVVAGRPRVPQTDQYITATILHELLTGSSPFRDDGDRATPIRKIRPSFSEELESALLRAMSVEPSDRFPTMSVFLDQARTTPEKAAPRVVGPKTKRRKDKSRRRAAEQVLGEKPSGVWGLTEPVKAVAAVALGVFVGVIGFLAFFAGDDDMTREITAPATQVADDSTPVGSDADADPVQRDLGEWEAGLAASFSCNVVTNPGFESGELAENLYLDPQNVRREEVRVGAGVDGTDALEIGDPGVSGDYGELLPVDAEVDYFFSLNSFIIGDVVESWVLIEWLDEAQQVIGESNELNLAGRPDGLQLLLAGSSPADAVYGVPRIHKGDGEGLLFIDELVFARADSECGSTIVG